MNTVGKVLLVVAVSVGTAGCASFVAPAYSPNFETIDQMKRVALEKMTVGEVQPRDPEAPVNKITLRGSSLTTAAGTFAAYLEKAIRSDLVEMGLFDATSMTRIDATILKNDIDISGFSAGNGVMEVRIKVSRKGAIALDKVYLANTQFESSFAGAVAIPKGQSEYPNLVRALLQRVYSDPEFIAAVKLRSTGEQ